MPIPVIKPTRADIHRCIARFADLKVTDGGLPDADLEGYRRRFRSVLGFTPPPAGEAGRTVSPVPPGTRSHIAHFQAGYGIAFVQAEPGQGVMMHVHDTVESFVVLEGTWRMTWEGDDGEESVQLEPKDSIAFPAFVQRQFHCVAAPAGQPRGTLLGIIGGDTPAAEYSPQAEKELVAAGRLPA